MSPQVPSKILIHALFALFLCVLTTPGMTQELQSGSRANVVGQFNRFYRFYTAYGGQELQSQSADTERTPVKPIAGAVLLSAANTRLVFVGIHTDAEDPDPRLGGFKTFSGKLKVSGGHVDSLEMEFDVDSLWTAFGQRLTTRLKESEYFDVEKFPKAKYVSTRVEKGENGEIVIVGDLTLKGKTHQVKIPAEFEQSQEGVLLKGQVEIDRRKFAMVHRLETVSPSVMVTISVGERIPRRMLGASTGAGYSHDTRSPSGINLTTFFKQRDANSDGKLNESELTKALQPRMKSMDRDGDGQLTVAELLYAIQQGRR